MERPQANMRISPNLWAPDLGKARSEMEERKDNALKAKTGEGKTQLPDS